MKVEMATSNKPIKTLTDKQKAEYISIIENVMNTYSTHDYKPRDWFDISCEFFYDRGHKIEDEESLEFVFDEVMFVMDRYKKMGGKW